MNILFLSHYFPPEVNAPASRTFEHCREWVKSGHRVTVVTCAPNHPRGEPFDGYKNQLFQREQVEGIDVIRIWTFLSANEGFLLRTLNYVSFMFMAILLSPWFGRADVVVSTSPQFFNGLAGYFVAAIKRARWVLEIRDLWPESIVAVGALTQRRIIAVLEWIELFAYRKADRIIVVTQAFAKQIGDKLGSEEKITVVKNGANLRLFTSESIEIMQTLPEVEAIKHKCIVAYVGTHGMAHGLDKVLEAADELRARTDIHFLFVGDGAERTNLINMSASKALDNCTFLGQLPKSMMPYIWSISSICLVVLRKNKTFESVIPSKIFECMAMGKPMILGVEGEAASIVKQANAGLCIEPENVAQMTAAITLLADDEAGRQAMGQGASVYVKDQFDREKQAQKMLAVLEAVAGRKLTLASEEAQR